MTPNSCFIFHFMPSLVAEPYIDGSGPDALDFEADEVLDLPDLLQLAYDDSTYSGRYPYDTSRLTIRKHGKYDKMFRVIEFAPREEDDVTYAVRAIVQTVYSENRYYTVEESASRPGRYLLCRPEVGRHVLLRVAWNHIPTDEELIEAVSSLEPSLEEPPIPLEVMQTDFTKASNAYHELQQRIRAIEAPYRRKRVRDGKEEEYIDYDAWEAADEDSMMTYGSAEHNAFSNLEFLESEIRLKETFLRRKLKEGNLTAAGYDVVPFWSRSDIHVSEDGHRHVGLQYNGCEILAPVADWMKPVYVYGNNKDAESIDEPYSDAFVLYGQDGLTGLVTLDGKVFPAIFDEISVCDAYVWATHEGTEGYLCTDGSFRPGYPDDDDDQLAARMRWESQSLPGYDRVYRYMQVEPPLFVCERNGQKGVIDQKGREIIPCVQDEICEQADTDGVIPFIAKGKWGLCHFGVCTKAVFDHVIIRSEEYCQVVLDGETGWVDSEGRFTRNPEEAWFGSWLDADK